MYGPLEFSYMKLSLTGRFPTQGEPMPIWWPPCLRITRCPAWKTAQMSSMTSWRYAGNKRWRRGQHLITGWFLHSHGRAVSAAALALRVICPSIRDGCLIWWEKVTITGCTSYFTCCGHLPYLIPESRGSVTQEAHTEHGKVFCSLGLMPSRIQLEPHISWSPCSATKFRIQPPEKKILVLSKSAPTPTMYIIGCENQMFRDHCKNPQLKQNQTNLKSINNQMHKKTSKL